MSEIVPGVEIKRLLSVGLTKVEVIEKAHQLTAALKKYQDIENQKKAEAERFKMLMENVDNEIIRLRYIIDSEAEDRMVSCAWELDLERNQKYLIRKDTGEEVMREALTDKERQLFLSLDRPAEGQA